MLRWALLMVRIRNIRKSLGFSKRIVFDDELRPFTADKRRIAYPDAIYHITSDDVERAMRAAGRVW